VKKNRTCNAADFGVSAGANRGIRLASFAAGEPKPAKERSPHG